MTTCTISMNDELAEIVEYEMRRGRYKNKSEFFRNLVRKVYLESEEGVIEEVLSGDPDYELVKKREKEPGDFIPLEKVMEEFGVDV